LYQRTEAQMIPWWKIEEKYAKNFKKNLKGQKAVSIRVALGALIIQERLGTDDRTRSHTI
jgi:IS5 family transposase